jgi:hypothetical protein
VPGVKVAFSQAPGFSCTISCIKIAIVYRNSEAAKQGTRYQQNRSCCTVKRVLNDLQRNRRSPRRCMIWLPPTLSPPLLSASCLSFSALMCVSDRAYGRGVGGRAKSFDGEKALPSINHSILSDVVRHFCNSLQLHLWMEGENCTLYKRTYISTKIQNVV